MPFFEAVVSCVVQDWNLGRLIGHYGSQISIDAGLHQDPVAPKEDPSPSRTSDRVRANFGAEALQHGLTQLRRQGVVL
jgi:hypothetical protein